MAETNKQKESRVKAWLKAKGHREEKLIKKADSPAGLKTLIYELHGVRIWP